MKTNNRARYGGHHLGHIMDDFGNSIVDFYDRVPYYGFAAFVLCAECNLAQLLGEDLLRTYGIIA